MKRQAGIAEAQNTILSRQTALSELTLRHALFEKRLQIYHATDAFLGDIVRYADKPESDVKNRFLIAMRDSQFIFRASVHRKLKDLWHSATNYFALRSEEEMIYAQEGHYGSGNPEKKEKLIAELSNAHTHLVFLFGDEMKLSEVPTS